MKVLRAILVLVCICLSIYGIQCTLEAIAKDKFDVVPLIVALVAILVLVLLLWYEIKGGKKKALQEPDPAMAQETFEKILNAKLKNSKIFLKVIIIFVCVAFAGIIILLITKQFIGMAAVITLSWCAFFILWGVYYTKYSHIRSNIKYLEKNGINLHSCLEGMENAFVTPENRLICTGKALISEKNLLVMPYSSVAWIYRTDSSVNGISMGSYWNIYTFTGEHFVIAMANEEVKTILGSFSDKFSKDIVLGYGSEQRRRYKMIKKEYKERNA